MTSYSTYGVNQIRYVDGSLSTDDECAAEQLDQIVNCVASGAMRALLDTTRDEADPDAEVAAVHWHSENEGWELDALREADRPAFMEQARRFVTDNLNDVITLAERIAWDSRWKAEMWHGNSGMGMYRVGMLLGYTGAGQGIGFADYADPRISENLTYQLDIYVTSLLGISGWQDSWIDSTEEPCLLHLT